MATQAKPTTHLNKAFHLHIGPCIAGRSAHIPHWKHGVHQAGWSISITYDEQWSMTIRSALTKMPNAWIIMNPTESWPTHLQTVQQNEHGTLLLALRVPQAERHFIQNALLRSTLPLRVRRLAYPTRSKTVCIRLYCCRLSYKCVISLHAYVYIYIDYLLLICSSSMFKVAILKTVECCRKAKQKKIILESTKKASCQDARTTLPWQASGNAKTCYDERGSQGKRFFRTRKQWLALQESTSDTYRQS